MVEKDKKVPDFENFDSLKEKLLAVTNELDNIKVSFAKSTEELSELQNMLDVGNMQEMSGVIEGYENKIAEEERKRQEASEGAKKYSEELEKEKERLVKLWDAYKNQEQELSNMEKKMTEYEEKCRTAESSKKQLEEDLTARINTLTQKLEENKGKINKFDQYEERYKEFDGIRNNLEKEIHALKEDISEKDETINQLSAQMEKIRKTEDYSKYKEKYEEINAEFEKEKERLTKLYHLYEETDNECKQLKEENKNWQKWWDSNKEVFEKIFSKTPPSQYTPSKHTEKRSEVTEKPEEIDNPTKKPKKKRLFRK